MADTTGASGVNKDIVQTTMDLVGYTKEGWAWVHLLTYANLTLLGAMVWVFIPGMFIWPTVTALVVLGLLLASRLFHIGDQHQEQTLSARNALERRLGLPEYARHREGYGVDIHV